MVEGSHKHFLHPKKQGKVTVPEHRSKDIPIGTAKNILKQAGLL
ncbi:type II toxin-antitoxin system HicA family toxin [Enterococcus sp. AZ109]